MYYLLLLSLITALLGASKTQTGTLDCSAHHLKQTKVCQLNLNFTRDNQKVVWKLIGEVNEIQPLVCNGPPVLAQVTGRQKGDVFNVSEIVRVLPQKRHVIYKKYHLIVPESSHARAAKKIMAR